MDPSLVPLASSADSGNYTVPGKMTSIEAKFPFHRLAILNDANKQQDSFQPALAPHSSNRSMGFPSVNSSSGEGLASPTSPSGSLATSQSRNSSLGQLRSGGDSGMDSRRSLQPSSSFGDHQPYGSISEHGMLKGTTSSVYSTAGDSIPEHRETLPPRGSDKCKSWGQEIDKLFSAGPRSEKRLGMASSNSSTHSQSQSQSAEAEKLPKLKEAKPVKHGSISGPFAHFRCNRKKKKCEKKQMCRWDMFPGIQVEDTHLPRIARQDSNSPPTTQRRLDSVATSSERDSGNHSPRGPLSVDLSEEGQSRSGTQDDLLARTFDVQGLHDLESGEQVVDDSPDTSRTSQDGSSQQSSQAKASAATAPALPTQAKEQPYQRSATAPHMHPLPSVRDTAKLRVEKFKGIVFVNEYALVRTLGKGSFGKVKLGLNTHDHELYALKLIPKTRRKRRGGAQPLVAEADVLQEITVMKELSHPNIVQLKEVIDDPANSKMLMVLEYVDGGSLFAGTKLSPKKRLTELAARKYFRDVLQGLDYLHSHKIAHGDLKPDNLLLGANGHIKIADFGSSQLTRVGDLVNRSAGTPAFMAPEMCTGEPYHARLADVWALGVCLYMFIFGRVPFKADSILGLYDQIRNAPLVFPEDIFVSESLKRLLSGLLDKDPENRMSLTGAMYHQWTTHNGAYPLPNIQGLEPEEEEDPDAYLMECWPDDPADIGLESVLKTIGPLFEQRLYQDGAFLARQGDVANCIFFVEEGTVQIYHTMNKEVADSDDEDGDEEEGMEGEVEDKRLRLKRQGSMLKTMFCATVRASRLVSAVRSYANGETTLLAVRGAGSFIGETAVYESKANAVWETCVGAKGPVKVLVLKFRDIMDLVSKRPEVEADIRAVMAQRKGELLKMEMLERLAGLHRDLEQEVEIASNAGGASLSAIAVARDLLSLPSKRSGPYEIPATVRTSMDDPGQRTVDSAAEMEQHVAAKAALRQPNGVAEAVVPEAHEGPEVEQSKGSEAFNVKGDSAKTLSAFPNGKTPSTGSDAPPPVPS